MLISLAITICMRLCWPHRHYNSRGCCNVSIAVSLFRAWRQKADQTRVREAIDTIPPASKRFYAGKHTKNTILPASINIYPAMKREHSMKSQTAFLSSACFCDISPEKWSARLGSSKRDRKYLRRQRWSVCTCYSTFFFFFSSCLPR